ncbi:hypothetical protein K523DRAFT_255549 [Schizophyllum commune Tattone D]|nr:hypothetical protein K523DRAFT_255549 [Schizophyllum commune Tattone D]
MGAKFQNIGFARRTGGPVAEIPASTLSSDTPRSPQAFAFRPSDVEGYLDLFTHAPLVRTTTRRGSPRPPASAVPLGLPTPRLPIDSHLRLATPHPTNGVPAPLVIPPPPGAIYEEAEEPLTPPSTPHAGPSSKVLVYRLRPLGQHYHMEGFPDPLPIFKLEMVDGEEPPPFLIHSGEPILIQNPEGGSVQEIWPVEALRFYPQQGGALIVVGYDGCPVLVETEFFRVREMYTRAHAWAIFHRTMSEEARLERHLAPFSAERRRRFFEHARATVIWELTQQISRKTLPPENHPAPGENELHVIELMAQHGLPGPV